MGPTVNAWSKRWAGDDSLINWAGLLLFSAIALTRLTLHPFWRDEAHAWLIAAAARSPLDLLAVPSEVHPPLWFWILEFIQLFTSDLRAMKVVIGAATVGTLVLLWLVSGLNLVEKALISASYYISWQYGVFSRNYMPGVFFLVLFAVLWRHWRKHPIAGAVVLGLACLTHAFFVPVAGILALLFLWDWWREEHTSRPVIFAGVLAIFMLGTVASLYVAAPTMQIVVHQAAPASETRQLLGRIGYAFTVEVVGEPLETVAGLLFLAAFMPLASVTVLAAVGAIFLSVSQVLVYGGMAWHVGTIYVLLVCLFVVYRERVYRPVSTALLALSAIGGVMVPINHTLPYSTGEQAAALIRGAGLQQANWAAFPDFGGELPFAVLRRPFWTIECDCEINRVDWRNRLVEMDKPTFLARFDHFVQRAPGAASYFLLSRSRAKAVEPVLEANYGVERIGETPPAEWPDESYFLLRVTRR